MRIKEVIKSRGKSVSSLALEMGIKQESLSRAINGNPTLETLQRIADTLNVEVWELFVERPSESEISGFIKVKGHIYEIKSREDIENLLKCID